ncbi:MAG: hypothetical protein RL186_258, partial [Pseudomonadota bacterium]
HYGVERVTTQNLMVVRTDVARGLILIHGSVPGAEGSWVEIRDAVKVAAPADAPRPAAFRKPGDLSIAQGQAPEAQTPEAKTPEEGVEA